MLPEVSIYSQVGRITGILEAPGLQLFLPLAMVYNNMPYQQKRGPDALFLHGWILSLFSRALPVVFYYIQAGVK